MQVEIFAKPRLKFIQGRKKNLEYCVPSAKQATKMAHINIHLYNKGNLI